MESQFQLTLNGQQLQQQDVNLLGQVAGLADDRVFAELFRMVPFDGTNASKGILPYAFSAAAATPTVVPNGATGTVAVNPFRAFVGSRTAVGTDATKNWRDVRSTIFIGSSSSLSLAVALAANSSGSPRWDLVYAAITPDTNGPTVSRKVKDPATKVITTQSVVTALDTTVSIGVIAGTPATFPSFPALPSDAAGTYYIPLAYVRVPNGFNATTTVAPVAIAEAAPVMRLSRAAGVRSMSVADQQYKLSSTFQQAWGSSGARSVHFIPPSLGAGEMVIVAVDLLSGVNTNWSHQNDGVIDSRDWRGRLCRYDLAISVNSAGPPFKWNTSPNEMGSLPAITNESFSFAPPSSAVAHGYGQTFDPIYTDDGATAHAGHSLVAWVKGDNVGGSMAGGTSVYIYCDHTDGGKLKLQVLGLPTAAFLFWLDFTAPFGNQ